MKPRLDPDALDLLAELNRADVRFVVVGGHALSVHGFPRATGDLDVFVEATRANAERLVEALDAFGAPLDAHGVGVDDFQVGGVVYQMGSPPHRIDVLTEIDGVDFAAAWLDRVTLPIGGVVVPFIGLECLIANKRSAARPKDLDDLLVL